MRPNVKKTFCKWWDRCRWFSVPYDTREHREAMEAAFRAGFERGRWWQSCATAASETLKP